MEVILIFVGIFNCSLLNFWVLLFTNFDMLGITSVMLTSLSQTDYLCAQQQLWEYLRPFIHYHSDQDIEKIELAFYQMAQAHEGQRRKNGDYYIIHPVEACVYLTKIGLDADTLCACLLHDVPEDTDVGLRELEEHFSREVIFLISGITKLSKIKYQGEDRYAENLRKMFVAMSRDLRVIFIKLADRLHNLKTLSALPPQKAKRIALESLEIYVPIAQKLGINYFKGQIEDEAFKYVYPDEYNHFVSLSNVEITRRNKVVDKMKKHSIKLLVGAGITEFEIKGRAKKYYSIYRKIKTKKTSLEHIRDLVAIRIICTNEEECYTAFSLINKYFTPISGTTKDYISRPKPNGYQSLHITVKDPVNGEMMEFQIRTKEMNEFAEYGVAAHWAYKQQDRTHEFLDSDSLKWITELVDLSRESLSEEEYLKHVKLDLFKDRIFVLTPNNDVINLPAGASPLDFAFRVHEQIGAHATLAKVNGQPMKLSGELQNGDVVEIITDKNQKPKLDWLGIVKTRQAASQIRYRLRKMGVLNQK